MDWTEKYRPHGLADLVGNGPSVSKLKRWADSWGQGIPKKRAVILAGPPGVGKTSAAIALAHDMDWAVIELNASDARNADKIRRVATAGAMHQTFGDDGAFHSTTEDGGRKLIILDEADNLYERMSGENAAGGGGKEFSDKGGKTQIINTIKEAKQPIVLIVNDLYALQKGSGSALKTLAETLKFSKVNVRSIPKALDRIARAEGVRVDRRVLEAIAEKAGGDLRAAVRDLETLCWGQEEVTVADLSALGPRDTTGNMFDLVRHVLKGRSIQELRREVWSVDATPEDIVLWIDENLAKEFKHPEDLVRGYDMLSRADIFLGRTKRTQNYGLWSYASDLATAGVMTAKQHDVKTGFVPFGFPQYLMKMSRSRGARQTKDTLALALGGHTHASKRKTRQHMVPVLEALFPLDREFAVEQTFRLELSDAQVALLLDTKVNAKSVKEIREAVKELEATHFKEPSQGLHWGGGDDEEDGDKKRADASLPSEEADDPDDAGKADEPEDKTPARGQKTLF